MKLTSIKLFLIIAFGAVAFILNGGCSNKPCRMEDRTVDSDGKKNMAQMKTELNEKDLSSRVFVAKPDGTLQCGMGKKIDLEEMKKELSAIEVFSADNRNDGLMRIQLCGHPTGNSHVFEIAAKDLDQAIKLGFKKWIRD